MNALLRILRGGDHHNHPPAAAVAGGCGVWQSRSFPGKVKSGRCRHIHSVSWWKFNFARNTLHPQSQNAHVGRGKSMTGYSRLSPSHGGMAGGGVLTSGEGGWGRKGCLLQLKRETTQSERKVIKLFFNICQERWKQVQCNNKCHSHAIDLPRPRVFW